MKRKLFFLLILGGVFAFQSCQEKTNKLHTISGLAQGSTYQIKYISDREEIKKSSVDSIFEVIDLSMSTYRSESIISKINRAEEAYIDTHFEKVFLASQSIWQQSEGLFDPTVGILVNAWGFGKNNAKKPPTSSEMDSLLLRVGFQKVTLLPNKQIVKQHSEIAFDFNAIAQGYTVDVLADFLKSKGIENFLVEVGGEIFLNGENTIDDKKWTIGVDDPTQSPENRTLITTLQFTNKGLATSGNYRKVWTDSLTGEKYVHSINPKTGLAKQSNILSVTVVTSNAMLADGYATMLMLMDFERSKQFLKENPTIDAMIIFNNTQNQTEIFTTEGFKKYQTE